jgi:hypothetical protein
MSLAGGSRAAESILKREEFWFTEAWRSFWKRRNQPGGIRWAVLIAIASSMLGSIFINPLSAGLLNIEPVSITQLDNFLTIASPGSPAPFNPITDDTFVNAIAYLVYNISTTVWLTDEYVIKPFWPSGNPPIRNQLSPSSSPSASQVWAGSTDIFKVQMQCEPMSAFLVNKSFTHNNYQLVEPFVFLQSTDGCNDSSINFYDLFNGGGKWAQFSVSDLQQSLDQRV